MHEDQSKIALEKAYQEFSTKVEEAKKIYHQKINEIMNRIDEMKVSQIKKNLNI